MNVILLEKLGHLGDVGDTVSVKPGYANNFLIPKGKAVFATKANVAKFEAHRAELEAKAAEVLKQAQERAKALDGFQLTIETAVSEEGKLYGSIGTVEIVKALEEAGHTVEKREVMLPEGKLHELGEFDINLQLHSDVDVTIHLIIDATTTEG